MKRDRPTERQEPRRRSVGADLGSGPLCFGGGAGFKPQEDLAASPAACEIQCLDAYTTQQQEVRKPQYPLQHSCARLLCYSALSGSDSGSEMGDAPSESSGGMSYSDSLTTQDESEYDQEVYGHLRKIEQQQRASPSLCAHQMDINTNMRAILVDWLQDVAFENGLAGETRHLSIAYLDSYLSCEHQLDRDQLQLVGVTCLFIASKFEEPKPLTVVNLVKCTDDTYTAYQVLGMERTILHRLGFNLARATTVSFLGILLTRVHSSCYEACKLNHMAHFLCDLSLQDECFLKYLPSAISASSVALAHIVLAHDEQGCLIRDLTRHSGYYAQDLWPCVLELHGLYQRVPTMDLHAVVDHYSSPGAPFCLDEDGDEADGLRPRSAFPEPPPALPLPPNAAALVTDFAAGMPCLAF